MTNSNYLVLYTYHFGLHLFCFSLVSPSIEQMNPEQQIFFSFLPLFFSFFFFRYHVECINFGCRLPRIATWNLTENQLQPP
jgi:hypothetical protein